MSGNKISITLLDDQRCEHAKAEMTFSPGTEWVDIAITLIDISEGCEKTLLAKVDKEDFEAAKTGLIAVAQYIERYGEKILIERNGARVLIEASPT